MDAPAPFREVTAVTHRIEAERCTNGVCTSISCGDAGVLELRFVPPPEAAAGALGYRLQWLGGDLPDALGERIDLVMPLGAADTGLSIELGWRGVTELDGQLALIAVDAAGNESEPSEAVHVVWSGCTDYYDDPFCLDKAPVSRAGQSCAALSAPHAGRTLPLTAAALLAALWAARVRARRERGCS